MSNQLFFLCFMVLCLVKIHWPAIRTLIDALLVTSVGMFLAALIFIAIAILDDLFSPTGEDLDH